MTQNENSYLRAVLNEALLDPENFELKEIVAVTEPSRVEVLELSLRALEREGSELRSQVSYWTSVSKKSQEAKLIAEASKSVLENELQEIKAGASPKRTSQKIIIDNLQAQLKEKEQFILKNMKTQEKIDQVSQGLEEAYSSADKLEKENSDLKKNLQLKENLIVDLKEQLSLFIDREENSENSAESTTKEKYDLILQENLQLSGVKKVLADTLDKINHKVSQLEIENSKLSDQVASISEKNVILEDEAEELKGINQKLKDKYSNFENVYTEAVKEISALKEKLKEKDSVISNLKSEVEYPETESLANISEKNDKSAKLDALEVLKSFE